MKTVLAKHLKDFFQSHLREQRTVSPNTIRSYRDTFKLLIHYLHLKNSSRVPAIEDLDPKSILAFLQYLEDPEHGRGNSAHTRNHRLMAIQSFFKYVSLYRPSLQRLSQRILAIPVKRTPSKAVESLDRKEMEALLAQPQTTSSDGIRNLAILTFLYNAGARASEAADARTAWFDFSNRCVTIVGKGRRPRTTPLWPPTIRLLKLYVELHRRKPQPGGQSFLFINQKGRPFTRFGIRAIVKKNLEAAAKRCPSLAAKKLSTHSLRHTCAVHLLESGVDPTVIKAWLGHASLQSTSRYLDMDLNRKRRVLEQFGPPRYVASLDSPETTGTRTGLLQWLEDL